MIKLTIGGSRTQAKIILTCPMTQDIFDRLYSTNIMVGHNTIVVSSDKVETVFAVARMIPCILIDQIITIDVISSKYSFTPEQALLHYRYWEDVCFRGELFEGQPVTLIESKWPKEQLGIRCTLLANSIDGCRIATFWVFFITDEMMALLELKHDMVKSGVFKIPGPPLVSDVDIPLDFVPLVDFQGFN